jgi:DNA polymerase III epsilon subunit-like protein
MTWGDSFVSFDTETTGVDGKARIVELAFVRFEKGEIKEQWSSFLMPDGVDWNSDGTKKALEVNQISLEQLKDAPSFMDVFHHVAAHLRAVPFWVAHNAEFDLRMFHQEHRFHKGTDFPIAPKLCFDTMALSGKIHPTEKTHKLANTAARWGVTQDGSHRAVADAITCGRILQKMIEAGKLPMVFEEAESFQKTASQDWKARRRY